MSGTVSRPTGYDIGELAHPPRDGRLPMTRARGRN